MHEDSALNCDLHGFVDFEHIFNSRFLIVVKLSSIYCTHNLFIASACVVSLEIFLLRSEIKKIMALAEIRKNAVERRNFLAPHSKLDDQKFEFIFVLDRSGSMAGSKMELAKNALLLFIRSLPVTCQFNIIGFGSTYDKLHPASVQYTEEALQQAVNYVTTLQADLAQTDLLSPLQFVYSSDQTPGFLTQIFVLTDGETIDPEGVIQLVQNNKSFARVFSLGIGNDVDHSFVTRLARTGGGVDEFVTTDLQKIQTKIQDQLKIALKPSLLRAVPLASS